MTRDFAFEFHPHGISLYVGEEAGEWLHVVNHRTSGKFIEILGSYNVKTGEVLFKAERISHWIKNGAQVSDTVHNFLVAQKLIEGKKKNVLSRKSPTKKRKELKK